VLYQAEPRPDKKGLRRQISTTNRVNTRILHHSSLFEPSGAQTLTNTEKCCGRPNWKPNAPQSAASSKGRIRDLERLPSVACCPWTERPAINLPFPIPTLKREETRKSNSAATVGSRAFYSSWNVAAFVVSQVAGQITRIEFSSRPDRPGPTERELAVPCCRSCGCVGR
jgi:hypothetical protein